MIDDSSIRLLAALGLSAIMGRWMRRRSVARVQLWERDAEAARERTVRAARITSTGFAYVGSAMIWVSVVLMVEVVVSVVHYFS